MSLFGFKSSADRYGVIIDIGSGSVLVAIIHSDKSKQHPEIVWSHREHAPLRNIDSLEQSAKAVMTALVNASIMLDAEGRKALYDYNNTAKLSQLQCSIAAPWSYTVTKTINYNQDKEFVITDSLIEELTTAVHNKTTKELNENEAMSTLGLDVIARSAMGIIANGYLTAHPDGQKVDQLSISYASAVAQKYLVTAIDEMHDKLFPNTENRKLSFALMFYCVTRDLLPESHDICLVDITYEATEIGVVRDGALQYCTHTSFGSFSLSRELSVITNVPLHEAFGYLHSDKPYAFMDSLPDLQRENVEAVFESYIAKVSDLFHETGDSLSIPKRISVHTDLNSESLFLDLVEKAAKRAIKTNPIITPISKEIIRQTYAQAKKGEVKVLPTDTALLLSAMFFHKQKGYQTFEYL